MLLILARQLDELCDELAVPIIMEKVAKEEPNPRLRLLFVEAFGKVPSYEANQALCYFAIEDPAVEVRERALRCSVSRILTNPYQ